jgi:hypothetical protein
MSGENNGNLYLIITQDGLKYGIRLRQSREMYDQAVAEAARVGMAVVRGFEIPRRNYETVSGYCSSFVVNGKKVADLDRKVKPLAVTLAKKDA